MTLQPLAPMEHDRTERRLARGHTPMDHRPTLRPGESWTPETAASFVAQYDADIAEALARLQENLEAAHPLGTVFVHRYTAETICRYDATCRRRDGQAMGYVEVRLLTGECYSGTVLVRWEDGAVITYENLAIPS